MLAWHFTNSTLRDGSPIPPIGEWLVHDGDVVLCRSGLHGSTHPMDALQYAQGHMLHRVDIDGDIKFGGDKICGRKRKILQTVDCEQLLRKFACNRALGVLPTNAPRIVRLYLETADESYRSAAQDATWDAAWDAARSAAWAADAAWNAAWNAARDDLKTIIHREFQINDQA